jgi:hypothetical protein
MLSPIANGHAYLHNLLMDVQPHSHTNHFTPRIDGRNCPRPAFNNGYLP